MKLVTTPRLLAAAALSITVASPAALAQDSTEFIFADVGTTHTGFIFPGDPRIGREVILTRIFLTLNVAPGADAADFDTDISFPIDPAPGSVAAMGLSGLNLGWSGSGTFTHTAETTMFNGTIVQTLFGAATAPMNAEILEGSRIEMIFAPIPAPAGATLLGLSTLLLAQRRRR